MAQPDLHQIQSHLEAIVDSKVAGIIQGVNNNIDETNRHVEALETTTELQATRIADIVIHNNTTDVMLEYLKPNVDALLEANQALAQEVAALTTTTENLLTIIESLNTRLEVLEQP